MTVKFVSETQKEIVDCTMTEGLSAKRREVVKGL